MVNKEDFETEMRAKGLKVSQDSDGKYLAPAVQAAWDSLVAKQRQRQSTQKEVRDAVE